MKSFGAVINKYSKVLHNSNFLTGIWISGLVSIKIEIIILKNNKEYNSSIDYIQSFALLFSEQHSEQGGLTRLDNLQLVARSVRNATNAG